MKTFDNDEDGYLRWVDANPNGFVINTTKQTSAYGVLHRANCTFIKTKQRTNYTTADYKKICSLDKQELVDWGRSHRRDFQECKQCKPLSAKERAESIRRPETLRPPQEHTSQTVRVATPSDSIFQRLITKCRSLPPAQGNYLVDDYVENLLITVLDFMRHGTTVRRALDHYYQHVRKEIATFTALKNLLARYPDTREGNLQIAQYLWGYNEWTKVELLRRLVAYFEAQGVTTQDQLKQWASKADFKRDFKGKVKGADIAIFNWLVMRQGVETIKPDTHIHRFVKEVLGRSVSNEEAVELLEKVAREMRVKAYELDWRIWEYQRGGPS